jgi:ATP-dependent helicase/nuclease subunit B
MYKNLLTDGLRKLIMSYAVDKSKDNLILYSKSTDINNIDLIVESLKEFKSGKISSEDIQNICNTLDEGILKQKLSEFKCIFDNYNNLTKKEFLDPLDNLNDISNFLSENPVFSQYTVFIDSFHTFNCQQMNIIENILAQVKESYITLCCDDNYHKCKDEELNLFSPVYSTINKLLKISANHRIKTNIINLPENLPRFKNNELKELQKNFFMANTFEKRQVFHSACRAGKGRLREQFAFSGNNAHGNDPSLYTDFNDNITIYNADNIYEECDYISKTIKKLIVTQHYRFKDFAIITGDAEHYISILKEYLKKYNIQYFIDEPKSPLNNSLLNLVFSVISCVINNYDSQDIIKYLKTGLTEFNIEEISEIENYILLWEIKNEEWLLPFTKNPRGFSSEFEDEEINQLSKLNHLRKKIISPLEIFKKNCTNASGHKICFSLYQFLERINIQKNIQDFCNHLIESKDELLSEELAKVWDILINSLDEIDKIFYSQKISLKKFMNLLNMAVKSEDIAFIPQNIDEVTVGSVGRIRLSNPKIIFIIGAIDGIFPKVSKINSIISDEERQYLISLGLNMNQTLKQQDIYERFLTYLAVTSSTEKVFISWPSRNISLSENLPSEIISNIKNIFPGIKVKNIQNATLDDFIWCESSAFELLVKNFQKYENPFYTLKHYFYNKNNYSEKILSLERIVKKRVLDFDDKENSKKLFGNKMELSASKIKTFYLCKFYYFCKYGLNAKERKKAKFDSLEYGNLIHFILENIFRNSGHENLQNCSNFNIAEKSKELINLYVNENLGGFENKSKRFNYQILKCLTTVELAVKYICDDLKQSRFIPIGGEIKIASFGDIAPLNIKIDDDIFVQIVGKIDRIDQMNAEDAKYIRIVDYKTGADKFKLSDILYGLNLQMFLYMMSVINDYKYKNVNPAGILYLRIANPNIKSEELKTKENIKDKIYQNFKMDGLILNNELIIEGMDKGITNTFIPVSKYKNNTFKDTNLISQEDFNLITEYIEKKVTKMGKNLINGKISASPLTIKNSQGKDTSCSICPYKPICGYEEEIFTEITDLNKEDVIKKIRKESDEK